MQNNIVNLPLKLPSNFTVKLPPNIMSNMIHIWIVMLVISVIGFIIYAFFCRSLYSVMKRIPKDKSVFPAWFCWLMLIPFFGYVFEWMMLPFGIPKTFEQYLPDNKEAKKKANSLFGIGLARLILKALAMIPFLNFWFIIVPFILLVIYWVKFVSFKKKFLL